MTKRNNGKGFLWLKQRFTDYVHGWIGYYYMEDMKSFLQETKQWYHRRLRSYIWKFGNEFAPDSRT
ncbi:MAG: hypothetical protein IKG99_04765 [Bacteroidaceae bacterium]|nr:hypothetical protein [Bacteroidaceae bacterium]